MTKNNPLSQYNLPYYFRQQPGALCLIVFCLCVVFTVGLAHSAQNELTDPESINQEMLRLEAIRISDHDGFAKGLENLALVADGMTAFQSCHYGFLKAYQTAFKGDYQTAIDDAKQLKARCKDIKNIVRMDALLANLAALRGDYNDASLYIDTTINELKETTDTTTKIIAYSAAAMVYNILGQKQLSIKYSEILYNLQPTTENKCRLQFSKNHFYLHDSSSDVPVNEVDYSDNACIDSGNLLFAQSLLMDSIYRKLKTENLSPTKLNELSELIVGLRPEISVGPYKNIQAKFAAIEAKFALLQGNINAAEGFAKATLDLNEGLGNTLQLIFALEVLEQVALSENKYLAAYQYLSQRNRVELNLYGQSKAKQMAFMTVKHSNLAKEFEIDQLNQQKAVLELEKQLTEQLANNQRLVIMLILTLLGLMVLWLYKVKKRHDYFKGVSEIDHLTKVLTRKAFEEQANALIKRMASIEAPIHLAIMDLDRFKRVNDNHGHLVGDWVLKNVVYACKELIEGETIIARLGGEEFCIVMPGLNFNEMYNKVEALRLAVETLDSSSSGTDIVVTASFGVSSANCSGYSLNMLLTHADVALFQAKKQGRNQVVIYNPAVP